MVGFAQKLHWKRPDHVGKVAVAFLTGMTVVYWILGGMMADAGTKTLTLIRNMAPEKLNIADICDMIGSIWTI